MALGSENECDAILSTLTLEKKSYESEPDETLQAGNVGCLNPRNLSPVFQALQDQSHKLGLS